MRIALTFLAYLICFSSIAANNNHWQEKLKTDNTQFLQLKAVKQQHLKNPKACHPRVKTLNPALVWPLKNHHKSYHNYHFITHHQQHYRNKNFKKNPFNWTPQSLRFSLPQVIYVPVYLPIYIPVIPF